VEPHQIITSRLQPLRAFELLNVGHERFGRLHFVWRGFDVRAMDAPDVLVVKNRLHEANSRERFPHAFQQPGVQYTGASGGFVGVVLEDVPRAER
jgi:hypothetical protein